MSFTSPQLAQTALISQIGGTVTSAAGSYYSGRAAQSTARFQADMADINARMAESSAQSALYQGQQQVGQLTLKAGQLKSSQRAALAANGVDLGAGSAAELQASTDLMKEIDANTLTANAVRSAWGYRTQAVNYQSEALMKRATADSISPMASAATSLLGSAGQVAGSWYMMNKAGALGGTASDTTYAGVGDSSQQSGTGAWRKMWG